MKERPIPMSGPMVRAILEGRKTQTRRVVKWPAGVQAEQIQRVVTAPYYGHGMPGEFTPLNACGGVCVEAFKPHSYPCPYGVPGDRLWVRETFYIDHMSVSEGGPLPKEMPDGWDEMLYYRADGECCQQIPECRCDEVGKPKWRSSIHMPRWACRLVLEVVSVRVERLQDISEADALSEGVRCKECGYTLLDAGIQMDHAVCSKRGKRGAANAFKELWESINGPGSWALNPWVWVVGFKRVEGTNG